ncbi:GATA transcription factor 21 [Quercus suber]|uniref:Gata transcription factor 22 n=1 Tax=Quercus suber TaxID=58331 RepID=A0AAW0KKD0_QUESU|nr:GATA transcription factor 21-like [Quercus suber]
MTTPYHNSPPSPFPLELNQDQHHQRLLISATPQVSSSSSSFSNPIFFNPAQDQGRCYYMALNHFQNDQEVDKLVGHGGSSCDHISLKNESESENKFSFWNKESKIEDQSETFSVKWMPSKMRMMRKMINSEQTGHADIPLNSMKKFEDQKQPMAPAKTDNSSNNSFNNNPIVRVCADCNTTKTPLWRSGPRGPKSLCNACGIRQRKARRAMAAAAAAANGTILATNPPSMKSTKVQHKDKRASKSYVPKFKKKCKLNTPDHGRKKVCFEDFTISLSKNSAFQQVFPQDEKEAAILLMALSYGLVHG